MTLILSVDVEDWAQSTLDTNLPLFPRAQRNTEYLLDVVGNANVKITCFILGKFAEQFPETVKRIVNEGHEIASHGYGHIDIYRQTPDEFREDIRKSKELLEDITGTQVLGYRGPCFSLGKAGNWPLEILAEEGFTYDSSIFPSATYRNGRGGWPAHPLNVKLESGLSIIEFPAAILKMGRRTLPVAGGGYHRLLPWPAIKWCVRKAMQQNEVFTYYCHPYEFDPQEFRKLPIKVPLKTRFHQGLGRRGFEKKFRKLASSFDTLTLVDLIHRSTFPSFDIRQCQVESQ